MAFNWESIHTSETDIAVINGPMLRKACAKTRSSAPDTALAGSVVSSGADISSDAQGVQERRTHPRLFVNDNYRYPH
jgi:hypothetical protein